MLHYLHLVHIVFTLYMHKCKKMKHSPSLIILSISLLATFINFTIAKRDLKISCTGLVLVHDSNIG